MQCSKAKQNHKAIGEYKYVQNVQINASKIYAIHYSFILGLLVISFAILRLF